MGLDSSSHCCGRVRTKAGGDGPHRIGRLLQRSNRAGLPRYWPMRCSASHWMTGPTSFNTSRRTGTGRQAGLPRHRHADKPAHAGAHPVQGGDGACWCTAPAGPACPARIDGESDSPGSASQSFGHAPHHIGADHACVAFQGCAPVSKSAPGAKGRARQTMGWAGLPVAFHSQYAMRCCAAVSALVLVPRRLQGPGTVRSSA